MSGSASLEGEEVLVGGERPDAGGIGIRALLGFRRQSVGASHAQMRQGSRPTVPHDPAVHYNQGLTPVWDPGFRTRKH
jgi:hypothetical protein